MRALLIILLFTVFFTQVLKAQQNLLNITSHLQQGDSAKISRLMFNTSLMNGNSMSLYQQDSLRISQSTTLGNSFTNTKNSSTSSSLSITHQYQTTLPVNNNNSTIITPLGNNTLLNTNNNVVLPSQTPWGTNKLLNSSSSNQAFPSTYHYLGTGHYLQNGGGN